MTCARSGQMIMPYGQFIKTRWKKDILSRMKTWICEFDSGEVRICSHFNCHGQEPRNELLPVAHKLVVNALQARPQLEDIEVWIGLERTSKYTRSLGSVLLRDDLLTSLYGRRPRKLVLYLYKDRLIIFRLSSSILIRMIFSS